MNFVSFKMRGQCSDDWRRRVDNKAVAGAVGGERLTGIVRRRIAGDDLDAVAAIGQQRGIKGVELLRDAVLEQPPVVVVVGAEVNGVDQIVAVVVVRGPADRDRALVSKAR